MGPNFYYHFHEQIFMVIRNQIFMHTNPSKDQKLEDYNIDEI